jgi:hypothetical protein
LEKPKYTSKNCTKTEKEETHAHRKRARSALSRERTPLLDSDGPGVGSAGWDWARVVKVNRRKRKVARRGPTAQLKSYSYREFMLYTVQVCLIQCVY